MALEQGSLNIMDNGDGTFSTVDKNGRKSHTVSGAAGISALKDAYGARIGNVLDSDGAVTETVYEYKEVPRKEVDPAILKEVPMMHIGWQLDAEGNKVLDANGKPILDSWGVKYADGTISYTGAGREGIYEAHRQRHNATSYNDFITDDRGRDDFASDQNYQDFVTVKNISIGQGSYTTITDKEGNSTLTAPNGAVVASGSVEEVRKEYRTKSNNLNLAMAAAERTQSFTTNEKRYVMEKQSLNTEEEFNSFVRSAMQESQKAIKNIYSSWGTAAQEQGISTEGKSWYQVNLPDLSTFIAPITESALSYQDWYSQKIDGIQPQDTDEESMTEEEVQGVVEQTIQAAEAEVAQPATPQVTVPDGTQTGVSDGTTNTATTTTGGYYQPVVQVPTATTTQTPGYQTIDGTSPTTATDTTTGTTALDTQTKDLLAVPETTITYDNYTGTTMPNLTTQSQQGYGGQKLYTNAETKQQLMVTVDANGKAMTYVPPGFTPAEKRQGEVQLLNKGGPVQGYAKGNIVAPPKDPMLDAKYRIARMNGYNGPKTNAMLGAFANASPAMTSKFNAIGVAMAAGGMIRGFDEGGGTWNARPVGHAHPHEGWISATEEGTAEDGTTTIPVDPFVAEQAVRDKSLITQTSQPMQAPVAYLQPQEADFIGATAGQAVAQAPTAEAAKVETVSQVGLPSVAPTTTMTPSTVASQVQATTEGLTPVAGTLGTQSQVDAAQELTSSVTGLTAETGTSTDVDAPSARTIQVGEKVSGEADAVQAAQFTEAIKAATATPSAKATVQGQLEGLMQQFEGGNTPAWAAGSMRNATAMLAARGLAASSMAGQAIIQATMEAALPIAQMDAQVNAQFEGQNLSNRQARAMLSAQQRATFMGQEYDQAFQAKVQNSARIGDIANMNFTAEQNIAMENSRAANTMSLNNLSNKQAMVMAEAAALSNLDMANLNNRQQAAVQNSQSFLQMDMANLSNEQQTAMFKAQQNVQALFTDQAAENASAQFNASSENQTNQFFANLTNQASQFNASQQNAMDQFNVNSVNALREFNAETQQQRDLFNAQNGLVIAQANAQWRQNLATVNTSAQNESNMAFSQQMSGLTARNLDAYWQTERDVMSFAFQTANNNADRATSIALQSLKNAGTDDAAQSSSSIFSKLAGKLAEKVFLDVF